MVYPKVSIITPIYNPKDAELITTMVSISNQTNKDFEWVVVFDGEGGIFISEHTFDIFIGEQFSDLRSIVRGVSIWDNYGPSVARNVGFQVSKGDYIAYVDMGDEIEPDRVERIISCFEDRDYSILFNPYMVVQIDEEYHYNLPIIFDLDPNKIRGWLQNQNICIPLGFAHKRKVWYDVRGFQPGIVCGEDGIFLRRAVNKVRLQDIGFDDGLAGTYYVNQTGQSRTQRRFEMGGFAFDGSLTNTPHGQYLDDDWFENLHSKNWYEEREE
ncbi:MAG: glycosyltransferase family 2 protein [Candidatus Kariarchaeaceae archaeon]|jgi:glycosyltransferase involved in cell wall biosynthesis